MHRLTANSGPGAELMKGEKFPPIRIVTRLISEMHAAIAGPGVKMVGGDINRFVIMTLIVHRSLGESPGISAYSLASSLGLPYETVRRQVGALMEHGWCKRSQSNAIITPPDTISSPILADMLNLVHDSLVRLIADIATLKAIPLPRIREPRSTAKSFTLRHGVQGAADIMLAIADGNRKVSWDWTDDSLYTTILAANVRHYARDPVLAWRYADHRTPAPEGLDMPVRASAIAWASGIAENTVRRRIDAMIAAGWLVKTKGGLIASQEWLNAPESVQVSLRTYQSLRRLFARFAVEGFPFEHPESAYIVGRPADVDFTSPPRAGKAPNHPEKC